MKQLLIDLGNTQVKAALYINGDLRVIGPVNAEQLADLVQAEQIKHIVYASVATSSQEQEMLSGLDRFNVDIDKVQTPAKKFGVTNGYANYQTLGIDRWLTLVACHRRFSQQVLIIDAGTALTMDVLAATGQHLGGWIIPGVQLQSDAIVDKAPWVFADADMHSEVDNILFGLSTPDNVRFGALAAVVGSCELAYRQAKALSEDTQVVLTGGNSKLIQPLLGFESQIIQQLVFDGLAEYAKLRE